jgi:hypothetical protein
VSHRARRAFEVCVVNNLFDVVGHFSAALENLTERVLLEPCVAGLAGFFHIYISFAYKHLVVTLASLQNTDLQSYDARFVTSGLDLFYSSFRDTHTAFLGPTGATEQITMVSTAEAPSHNPHQTELPANAATRTTALPRFFRGCPGLLLESQA